MSVPLYTTAEIREGDITDEEANGKWVRYVDYCAVLNAKVAECLASDASHRATEDSLREQLAVTRNALRAILISLVTGNVDEAEATANRALGGIRPSGDGS